MCASRQQILELTKMLIVCHHMMRSYAKTEERKQPQDIKEIPKSRRKPPFDKVLFDKMENSQLYPLHLDVDCGVLRLSRRRLE